MEPELTFSLVRSLTGRILIIINICLFVSTQEKQTIDYTGIRLLGNKTPYTDKIRLVEINNKINPFFIFGFHANEIKACLAY